MGVAWCFLQIRIKGIENTLKKRLYLQSIVQRYVIYISSCTLDIYVVLYISPRRS